MSPTILSITAQSPANKSKIIVYETGKKPCMETISEREHALSRIRGAQRKITIPIPFSVVMTTEYQCWRVLKRKRKADQHEQNNVFRNNPSIEERKQSNDG